MIRVAFFDAKEYDIHSFEKTGSNDVEFKFLETKLTEDTVELAKGCDAKRDRNIPSGIPDGRSFGEYRGDNSE